MEEEDLSLLEKVGREEVAENSEADEAANLDYESHMRRNLHIDDNTSMQLFISRDIGFLASKAKYYERSFTHFRRGIQEARNPLHLNNMTTKMRAYPLHPNNMTAKMRAFEENLKYFYLRFSFQPKNETLPDYVWQGFIPIISSHDHRAMQCYFSLHRVLRCFEEEYLKMHFTNWHIVYEYLVWGSRQGELRSDIDKGDVIKLVQELGEVRITLVHPLTGDIVWMNQRVSSVEERLISFRDLTGHDSIGGNFMTMKSVLSSHTFEGTRIPSLCLMYGREGDFEGDLF